MKRLLRYTLPALLLASWAVAVAAMWRGLTTIPSAERLRESHMVRIPTPTSFAQQVALSAFELVVVLLLCWPGRALVLRLWAATLGVTVWFLATTPLGINTVQWAHRRWLAAIILMVLAAAIGVSLAALRRPRSQPIANLPPEDS